MNLSEFPDRDRNNRYDLMKTIWLAAEIESARMTITVRF